MTEQSAIRLLATNPPRAFTCCLLLRFRKIAFVENLNTHCVSGNDTLYRITNIHAWGRLLPVSSLLPLV